MSEFTGRNLAVETPLGAERGHFPGVIVDGDPYGAHSVLPFDYWHGKPENISGVEHWNGLIHPRRSTYVTGMVDEGGELAWGEGVRRHAVPIAAASNRKPVATFQAIWDHDSPAPREISVVVTADNDTAADPFIQMLQRSIIHPEVFIKRTVIGPNHTVLSDGPSVPLHHYGRLRNAAEASR